MYILDHWQPIAACVLVALSVLGFVYSAVKYGSCNQTGIPVTPVRVTPTMKAIYMTPTVTPERPAWFTETPTQDIRLKVLLHIATDMDNTRAKNAEYLMDLTARNVLAPDRAEALLEKLIASATNGHEQIHTALAAMRASDFDQRDFYPILRRFSLSHSARVAMCQFYEGTLKSRDDDTDTIKEIRLSLTRAILEHMRDVICRPQRQSYNDYFGWAIITRIIKDLKEDQSSYQERESVHYWHMAAQHIANIRREHQ